MKEIKFRGKRIENGEWVYGYLVKQFGKFKIYDDSKEDFNNWVFEVDPKTVGQYIGLNDKNGKEIYEGDILRYENEAYKMLILVELDKEEAAFNFRTIFHSLGAEKCIGLLRPAYYSKRSSIVANIHERPELLEGDRHEMRR